MNKSNLQSKHNDLSFSRSKTKAHEKRKSGDVNITKRMTLVHPDNRRGTTIQSDSLISDAVINRTQPINFKRRPTVLLKDKRPSHETISPPDQAEDKQLFMQTQSNFRSVSPDHPETTTQIKAMPIQKRP